MNKKLIIKNQEGYDFYYDYEKVIDADTGKELFYVYNLAECPEDAIIGRNLFDGSDYIRAVEYGIELAKQGYDGIGVETITVPHGEDDDA